MGRRNYSAYTDDDWRSASSSLRKILSNGWPVYADCDLCDVRLKVDVERVAQIAGGQASLWGAKPHCRCVGCPGRVTFYLDPLGASTAIAMTTLKERSRPYDADSPGGTYGCQKDTPERDGGRSADPV